MITTVFSALLLTASQNGLAQDTEITLDLTGTIEPRCELTNLEKEVASFKENISNTVLFNLYCNLDMSMRIESLNGGLLNTKAVERYGFNENMIRRYDAKISIDSVAFETTIASAVMVDGASFLVTGGVVFDSSGSIEIKLDNELGEGHAGDYVDEIKIAVYPSLAGYN
jgi:hypothetical protein